LFDGIFGLQPAVFTPEAKQFLSTERAEPNNCMQNKPPIRTEKAGDKPGEGKRYTYADNRPDES
jgi:hypothetical protein